ncbi:hypothetical protein EI983_13585 [Roseovarius faecimaris]|uniref:CBU-0592-like domain-containing protein n=1 Tax=Roseovarius faecimaris TaxID=2494550 RepID=A0A6I6IQ00_9RHOB|nr:hypothetical protein [Roseovarius faecimaris]QGX99240.1 hypothetical protein EI983_13585 [Roseovarius faecimaris]
MTLIFEPANFESLEDEYFEMSEFIEFLRAYPETLQTIGVVGFLTYIIGFKLVQTGHLCGNGVGFALTNVIAACLVLVSLVGAFNLASFLIQVSYILIGLYGIGMRLAKARRTQPGRDLEILA